MKSVRCFIAVELPTDTRQVLATTAEQLSSQVDRGAVRWVKPSGVHLTLKFLGDTEPNILPSIGELLDEVTSGFAPYRLELGALGCFPNPRRPRVIWLGLKGELDRLIHMQSAIEEGIVNMGWAPENRRFSPHLTLGRVKDSRKVVDARLPWGQPVQNATFEVANICLFESDLQPSGAVYSIRHASRLGQPDKLS